MDASHNLQGRTDNYVNLPLSPQIEKLNLYYVNRNLKNIKQLLVT
jgi:hypothetical protein